MTRNEIERAALLEKERLEDEKEDKRHEKADRKKAYADRLIDRLKRFMDPDHHDLTQKQLADIMDDNPGNLSKILNGTGEKRYLSPYHINRICKEYGVTADHFIMDDFPEETHAAHDICSVTGLSEPAVKNLCMLNADTSDHDLESNWILQTINVLLENCISGSAIEEGTLWMSPLYHIAEYIGITPSPTINGEDKAWLSFNTGNTYGQYSQVESVRELYAERTLRQITRDLDHLKKILENKK